MVSRRTNFGERSEPAPDRGSRLQSAGGGQHKVTFPTALFCNSKTQNLVKLKIYFHGNITQSKNIIYSFLFYVRILIIIFEHMHKTLN